MHPRPGRVPTSLGIPTDIPRGTVPGRVLGVPACAGGVPGAASAVVPVPLAAAGERAARKRSEDVNAVASAECASECPDGMGRSGGRVVDPEYSRLGRIRYSLSVGYSEYSHGVSCAWTRMADSGRHRE